MKKKLTCAITLIALSHSLNSQAQTSVFDSIALVNMGYEQLNPGSDALRKLQNRLK